MRAGRSWALDVRAQAFGDDRRAATSGSPEPVRSRTLRRLIKLPKDLLEDPRHQAVSQLLEASAAPLWEGGKNVVATVPLTQTLTNVLRHALHTGLAVQGLELITEKLASEQQGLDAASRKLQASPSPARMSRLLFVANDGSKRFYRDCDGILSRYAMRLSACRIDLPGEAFGQALFGSPKLVRSVLVLDKKVVSHALLASLAE